MIRQEIYPKTVRIGMTPIIVITEKVDGSNLCFYNDGLNLYICQRTTIYTLTEVDDIKNAMYQGLYGWLKEHGEHLQSSLRVGSVICGEWIGMGKLKYDFEHKWLMFAKANMTPEFKLKNIHYEHELFNWAFNEGCSVMDYIGIVPVVYQGSEFKYLDVSELNKVYDDYSKYTVRRNVEGFVVSVNGQIQKYVRMKNGKIADHHASGEGQNE